jgi:hypothetical protein
MSTKYEAQIILISYYKWPLLILRGSHIGVTKYGDFILENRTQG